MPEYFLGIEIGGTKLQLFAGNAQADILRRKRLEVLPAQGAQGIRQAIEVELAGWLNEFSPSAIGVGFGGPVHFQSGRVARSHQVSGWSDFALGAWLESVTHLPVVVENDANTGAFGEALFGAGRGHEPIFYVTLGSGVGGGLVTRKQIYHGAFPGESEIGHLRLDRQGRIVESICSGWAVNASVRQMAGQFPASHLAAHSRLFPGMEAKALQPALLAQDPAASSVLQEVAATLALALSHVTHLFHPEIIVLGGGLSLLGQPLVAAVEEHLQPLVMEVFRPIPRVVAAELQEDAVPRGALALAARIPR